MTDEELIQSFQQHFSQAMPAQPAPAATAREPFFSLPQQHQGELPNDLAGGLMTVNPQMALAAHAGNAALRSVAGIGDSVINAGKQAYGAITGQDMGPKTTPLGNLAERGTVDTSHADRVHENTGVEDPLFGMGYATAAKGADVAGDLAPGMAIGQGAVNVAAKRMAAVKPTASAATRLGKHLDAARNYLANLSPTFQRFGTGPGATLGQRVVGGAGAGAVAAGAVAPDNPQAIGMGAGIGAVGGPVVQGVSHAARQAGDVASRMFNKNRAPELAQEVIRDAIGPRAAQVQANIGAASSRITPGLPVQVADDPGLSGVHRYVAGQNPQFAAGAADFMRKQAADLADQLRNRSSGLGADKAARTAATEPLRKKIAESTQPISTRSIAKEYTRLLPGGELQGSKVARQTFSDTLDPLITRMGPRQEGLLKHAPAGVLHNIRKDINAKLRPNFTINGSALTSEQAAHLRDIKSAIDSAMNRASPAKGSAAKDNRTYLRTYRDMSEPINQKENFRTIYEKAEKGDVFAIGGNQRETLSGTSLANSVKAIENDTRLWNQFTPEQQTFLKQLRHEAPLNERAANLGSGGAASSVNKKVIPPSVTTMARPLPGWMGRLTSGSIRTLSGAQTGRIDDELARMLSTPQGIQEIERILQGVNRPMPQASGRLGHFLLTGAATGGPQQF